MADVVPFGEWKPDVSSYKGQHSPVITNAYPRGDGYGPVPSFAGLSDALGAANRGFFTYFHTDGTVRLFAGTSVNLYLMSNSDYSWTDVSEGASYSALSSTGQWQFTQFGARVIAVQANDTCQSYVVGSSTDFADLGGSPPNSAYVTVVGQFVVLSGLTGDPFTIQWSSIGNPAEWTAGTNQGDTNTFSDGGLVRGVAGGEYGIVFQDSCIRQMTYQPGSEEVFSFTRLTEDFGLMAPYSVVRAGHAVFFLSHEGFQKWDPQSGFTPIGRERVDRTFFEDCDRNQPQLIIGASDPTSTRVVWAYKSVQGVSGLFDRVIVYDYVLDRWAGYVNLMGEYISSAATPGVTLENLDSISGSIDALSVSLDDFPTAFARTVALANSSHIIGLLNGPNLEATLETPTLVQDKRVLVRASRPVTDCSAVLGSLGSAQNTQDTISFGTESAVNAVGFCPHRADTRLVRFRNRFPAASTWSYAIGVEPDMVLTGQR